jgi:REP element-mobilizing transposase RayT
MKYSPTKYSLTNTRKIRRPLSFKQSTHLIFRLKHGLPPLFDPRDQKLRCHIFKMAKKYNIRIYQLIFNHSHLHGVVLLSNRTSYVQFIRELTSYAVLHFTRSVNIPGLIFKKVFLSRPFTRIVPWGKAYNTLLNYMKKNEIESGAKQFIHKNESPLLRFCGLAPPEI